MTEVLDARLSIQRSLKGFGRWLAYCAIGDMANLLSERGSARLELSICRRAEAFVFMKNTRHVWFCGSPLTSTDTARNVTRWISDFKAGRHGTV